MSSFSKAVSNTPQVAEGEPAIITTCDPQELVVMPTGTEHIVLVAGTTAEGGLQTVVVNTVNEARESEDYLGRVKGERTVRDMDSFLAELTRRPLPEGIGTLWGSYEQGKITAIYNDHNPDAAGQQAGHRDDRLILALRSDDDWTAWHHLSDKHLDQENFGNAIEELLHTVVDPDQADLMEVIDSIRASSRGEFESKIERSSGSQKLTYNVDVSATAGNRTRQLEIPKVIAMELRPWEGHIETYRVEAWFRYKVTGGALSLAVKLKPTSQIKRQAWSDLTSKVVTATSVPVYAG